MEEEKKPTKVLDLSPESEMDLFIDVMLSVDRRLRNESKKKYGMDLKNVNDMVIALNLRDYLAKRIKENLGRQQQSVN